MFCHQICGAKIQLLLITKIREIVHDIEKDQIGVGSQHNKLLILNVKIHGRANRKPAPKCIDVRNQSAQHSRQSRQRV